MDHFGNECDSKQKCIRVLAVFLLLPADKGTDDPVDDRGEHTGYRGDPFWKDQIPMGRRDHCRDKARDRPAKKSGGQNTDHPGIRQRPCHLDPDVIRDDAEDAENHAEKHLFQESLPDTLPSSFLTSALFI